MVLFGIKGLYSGKVVVFQEGGCIRAQVVVFGQSDCSWEKSCIHAKLLYWGKKEFIREKWL